MAEAVVDQLEAIEIEIERRKAAAAVRLEVLQALTQPLDEDGAVAQAGQRIAESALAIVRNRMLRVGERSGNPRGAPFRIAVRDASAQESQVGAVLVADAMVVHHMIVLSGQMRAKRLLERFDVVDVDAIEPVGNPAGGDRRR